MHYFLRVARDTVIDGWVRIATDAPCHDIRPRDRSSRCGRRVVLPPGRDYTDVPADGAGQSLLLKTFPNSPSKLNHGVKC